MGDLAPALLLLAVAGRYALIQNCHYLRYRAEALEWDQLLFESTGLGALAFFLFRLLNAPFEHLPAAEAWRSFMHAALPFPLSGSLVGAFLLSLAGAKLTNLMIDKEAASALAMSRYGSEMLALLFEAWEENFPVALTTKSRKFYVGFIVAQASLDPRIRDTRILPILSGYRDEKTARVVFTTDYRVPYATLAARVGAGEDVEDFGIVLPLGEIASAFRFDFDTYQEFGAAPPPGPGDLARG